MSIVANKQLTPAPLTENVVVTSASDGSGSITPIALLNELDYSISPEDGLSVLEQIELLELKAQETHLEVNTLKDNLAALKFIPAPLARFTPEVLNSAIRSSDPIRMTALLIPPASLFLHFFRAKSLSVAKEYGRYVVDLPNRRLLETRNVVVRSSLKTSSSVSCRISPGLSPIKRLKDKGKDKELLY